MVELNYCNNSKKKKENGEQDETREKKERRKGGKGKGRNEREKKYLGRKSINRDDESSVVGRVGRFFFQSPGGLPKTRVSDRVFGNRGLEKKIVPRSHLPPSLFCWKRYSTSIPTQPALRPKTPSILRVIPFLRPNIPTRPTHTHP